MRIGMKHIASSLAVGTGAVAAICAICAPPMAAGQPSTPPPTPTTVTVTVMAPPPGPQDNQSCTIGATATKCQKNGDAEINAAIPAPYPGAYGIYGPFWGGSAG